MRLIQPAVIIPRYRMLRMPVVAAEFSQYIDVEINDENIEKLDLSEVDLVGLTCQSYNAYRAFYISEEFRKKGVKTILGGVFATAMPEMALEYFDSVVVGEVEGLGEEIISDLKKGSLKRIYKNVIPPDISETHMPRMDLLNHNKYYRHNFPIETSRGCPHKCSFCFGKYQYPVYRKRSLKDIERDLGQWDYGVVEVLDHHCAADKKHLFEVCDLFRNMNIVSWIGEATLMSLDDEETLKRLADSNCRMIFVGMESISEKVLDGINKGFNNAGEYKRIIKMCQDYGIFIQAGLMWGLDGEDESVYGQTVKFCEDTKMFLAGSNIVTYFPGTDIYEEFKEKGMILSDDMRDYDSARITVTPEGFNAKKLLKGIKKFHNKLYSFRSIIKRAFQSTNRNMMLLIDYFAFNYSYRVYYKSWAKKVGQSLKEMIKSEQKGEKYFSKDPGFLKGNDSLPLRYRSVPIAYDLQDWNWRYWEFWLRKFIEKAKKPGILFNLIAFVMLLISVWTISGNLQLIPGGGGIVQAVVTYIILWISAELMVFAVSGRVKNNFAVLAAGLVLALPLIYFPFIVENLYVRLILAAANTVFITKNISFFFSPERQTCKFFRYHVFMCLSPELNFESSFQLDLLNSTFGKAFKLMFLGLFQLVLAGAVFMLISFIYIEYPEAFTEFSYYYWLAVIPKALYLYFAFAGSMNVITGCWVVWGYRAENYFRYPLLSASVGDFWRRFNSGYYRWALKNIYIPLVRRSKKEGKVSRTALLFATAIPFLISAILSAYIFSVVLVSGGVGSYYVYIAVMAGFFFIHYAVVTVERLLCSGHAGSKGAAAISGRIIKIIFTLVFVIASSALFFFVTDKVFLIIVQK
ncbi:radical SAM protein [Elusimicrobiota bacterium]